MDTPKYEVGQKLVLVYKPGYHKDTPSFCTIIVTKVGRKWISYKEETSPSFRGDRFDAETRYVDGRGYSSHSTVWRTQEEYKQHVKTADAWLAFRNQATAHYAVPKGVTLTDIEQANKLLFKESK